MRFRPPVGREGSFIVAPKHQTKSNPTWSGGELAQHGVYRANGVERRAGDGPDICSVGAFGKSAQAAPPVKMRDVGSKFNISTLERGKVV